MEFVRILWTKTTITGPLDFWGLAARLSGVCRCASMIFFRGGGSDRVDRIDATLVYLIGSPSGEPMFSLCRKWRKFAGHCKVT